MVDINDKQRLLPSFFGRELSFFGSHWGVLKEVGQFRGMCRDKVALFFILLIELI